MDEVIEARFEAVESEDIRQNARLSHLETKVEQINDIVVSIKELSVNLTNICKTQEIMRSDIEAIKNKPSTYWDKLVWLVIGALVTYVFKSLGM